MGFKQQKEKIENICRELLTGGKVDIILGFASDSVTDSAVPLFIHGAEDLSRLCWNETCTPNLSIYLTEKKGRMGIIAKPCDARAIAVYLAERQLVRDDIYLIGVECAGMKWKDGAAAPGCAECTVKVPPIYDILVCYDGAVTESPMLKATKSPNDIPSTSETTIYSPEGKLQRFQKELEKCILCYSCRQACYGCYCSVCFIDRGMTDWSPSEPDMSKKMMFHLGRAMHLASRCVGCGACERACPSGVKIRYLVQELSDFSEELYGTKAGMNPEETPAITSYSPGDKEVGFLDDSEEVKTDGSCCDSNR